MLSACIAALACACLQAQVFTVPDDEIGAIVQAMNREPLELSVGTAPFPRWHPGFTLLTMTDDSDCPYLYINGVPFTYRQIDASTETVGYGAAETTYLKVKYGMFPLREGDAERRTTLPEQLMANAGYMGSPAITRLAASMDTQALHELVVSKEMMMGFSGGLGWGMGGFSIAFFIGSALSEGKSYQGIITTGGVICAVGAVGSVFLFNLFTDDYNRKIEAAYREIARKMLE
jgi:hypothetical protein